MESSDRFFLVLMIAFFVLLAVVAVLEVHKRDQIVECAKHRPVAECKAALE